MICEVGPSYYLWMCVVSHNLEFNLLRMDFLTDMDIYPVSCFFVLIH